MKLAKFSELVWFRILAKQLKLAEQWKEAHWVGKSERSDEHLLAIRGSTSSARTIRRKPREEHWNLESVKAALECPWELRVCTEFDAPVRRQKYITNQKCWTSMDERRFAHWVQDHIRPSVKRDSKQFGAKNLLKQQFQIVLKRKLQIGVQT